MIRLKDEEDVREGLDEEFKIEDVIKDLKFESQGKDKEENDEFDGIKY